MEEILKEIEVLKNTIKSVEDKAYSNVFNSITNVLESIASKVEELEVVNENMEENISFLNSDISNIQEELFEEVSFEELEEMEDEYEEIECKCCHKPLFVEKSAINNKDGIPCPFCNEKAN